MFIYTKECSRVVGELYEVADRLCQRDERERERLMAEHETVHDG